MKLMKTKTQSLFKISQELQVSKVDIQNSVQTFRKDKKNLEDPGVFLSPKEKKKWNKLSPRKKAVYYKKAKKQMKSPYAFSVEQENGWNAINKIRVDERKDQRSITEKQSKMTCRWHTERNSNRGKAVNRKRLGILGIQQSKEKRFKLRQSSWEVSRIKFLQQSEQRQKPPKEPPSFFRRICREIE